MTKPTRDELERQAYKAADQTMWLAIQSAMQNAEDTCSELALNYHNDPEAYEARYDEVFWSTLEFNLGQKEYATPHAVRWFAHRGIAG